MLTEIDQLSDALSPMEYVGSLVIMTAPRTKV